MARHRRMHEICLPLVFLSLCSCSWQQVAQAGHRKIPITKLANRVLMSTQYSGPSFYNAFDPAFPNHASMDSPHVLHHDLQAGSSNLAANDMGSNQEGVNLNANHPTKHSVELNDNINNDGSVSYNNKADLNNEYGASLDSAHDAAPHPTTTTYSNYNYNHDNNNDHSAASTQVDYKANGDNFKYPSFSAPSTSSQFLYGRKFPASFETRFLNKESFSYGQDSPSSREQQGLYTSTPSSEQQQNLYTSSPSGEKSLYTPSSTSEQASSSSSPSKNYKASYPFNDSSADHSPSTINMPKVSGFNEFTQSRPVLSFDSFFNNPTINTNAVHTSPLGRPTFPVNDHGLTYGQVQVP